MSIANHFPETFTFFLEDILDDLKISGQSDIKASVMESILVLNPNTVKVKKELIKIYRQLIKDTYANRKLYDFEYYLSKIKNYDPIFENFYRLYARQFLKADVTLEEWQDILDQAINAKSDVERNIRSQLITKYIHLENLEKTIEEFKAVNAKYPFGKQDIRLTIGITKLALKQGKLKEAQDLKEYINGKIFDRDLKEFSKLKLFEIYSEIELQKDATKKASDQWVEMFELLKGLHTTPDNQKYILHLESIYKKLGELHEQLLDVRISPEEQKKLVDLVEGKIVRREPFLLLRLGDAESYGLESVPFDVKIFEKDCNSREMKWWGENLSEKTRSKVRQQFRETLYDSDVVGISSIFRFVSDLSDLKTSFGAERNQRGSVVVMDSMHDLAINHKFLKNMIITENRCHHVLFNQKSVLELAKKAAHVIVISHYQDDVMKRAFDIPIDTIQIPGEGLRHESLPYKIEGLAEVLKGKMQKGTVVFVAAGFAGKYFLKVAKDMGGIGLDVGAMADYWVGIKSRGVSELV